MQNREKTELRRQLLLRRAEISCGHREEYGLAASLRLLQSELWSRTEGVLLTVPLPEELDVMPLLQTALQQGKPLFLPCCRSRKLIFYRLKELGQLRKGAFGLWEPPEDQLLERGDGMLLVAPAVACDRQGFRLGMGGGYYDRFLPGFHGSTVCLVYDELLFDTLPTEPFDIPVQYVFTQLQDFPVQGSVPK
ncbi:MAG: 5-formyltetrahydrofolate cyclo-ligase [Clostridia bacterium]|nr:5-formyltetrahydrofolate cyclo-ligase [Clostridia bacterium]